MLVKYTFERNQHFRLIYMLEWFTTIVETNI